MRRRLYTILSALSLVFCIGTCALWARSHYVTDMVLHRRADGGRWVRSAPGALVAGLDLSDWSHQNPSAYRWYYERQSPAYDAANDTVGMLVLSIGPHDVCCSWERAGLAWSSWRPARGGAYIARLVVPLWPFATITAVLPAVWLAVRLRVHASRHLSPGRCLACGYDLRATPERCPECGNVVTPKAGAIPH